MAPGLAKAQRRRSELLPCSVSSLDSSVGPGVRLCLREAIFHSASEVLNSIGQVAANLFTAGRSHQHADSYSDANAQQHKQNIIHRAVFGAADGLGDATYAICGIFIGVLGAFG